MKFAVALFLSLWAAAASAQTGGNFFFPAAGSEGAPTTDGGVIFSSPPPQDYLVRIFGSYISVATPPTDVRRWGAKCDGATDDGPAFQLAIDAVAAFSPLGDTVYVPSGTCMTAQALIAKSGVTLIGAGMYSTVIKLTNTQDEPVVTSEGASRFALRDLTIDGNRANQTSGNCITGSASAPDLEWNLTRVRVRECDDNGFLLGTEPTDLLVRDSVFEECDVAGLAKAASGSASRVQLLGNLFRENTGDGINFLLGSNAVIVGNVLHDNVGDGIELAASDSVVVGNTFESNSALGLNLAAAADNVTVVGNTFVVNGTGAFNLAATTDGVAVAANAGSGSTLDRARVTRTMPSTAQATCSAEMEGSMYYDAELNAVCVCDGTNWTAIDAAVADTPSPTNCGA